MRYLIVCPPESGSLETGIQGSKSDRSAVKNCTPDNSYLNESRPLTKPSAQTPNSQK